MKDSTAKINATLAKGQDMTKADIQFLLNKEVQKTFITKALNMEYKEFNELWTKWSGEELTLRSDPKLAKARELIAQGGMDIKEIVEATGAKESSVRTYYYKTSAKKKKEQQDPQEQLEELHRKLEDEHKAYIILENQLEQAHKKNDELQQEVDRLYKLNVKTDAELENKKNAYEGMMQINKRVGELLGKEQEEKEQIIKTLKIFLP